MFKSKTKGLFVDFSEHSILAARTSGYRLPMVVEEIAEFPLRSDQDSEEIRDFLRGLVDFRGANYVVSRCGVYPKGRFVRHYKAESLKKVQDEAFLKNVLKEDFKIDPEENTVAMIDARDGSDFHPKEAKTQEIIFCGAPNASLREEQDRLVGYGLYPERLEISTISTLGGISDYARLNKINSPILCFELTGECANIFIMSGGRLDVARAVPFGMDSIYPLLQRELGLKDGDSARKLFFSNTFDFSEIGPKLLLRIIKELQSTSGFYEVQTGQSISYVFPSVLPKNLNWVSRAVADSLALQILQPSLEGWLESLNVKLGDGIEVANLGERWMGLFSLMGEFQLREEVVE